MPGCRSRRPVISWVDSPVRGRSSQCPKRKSQERCSCSISCSSFCRRRPLGAQLLRWRKRRSLPCGRASASEPQAARADGTRESFRCVRSRPPGRETRRPRQRRRKNRRAVRCWSETAEAVPGANIVKRNPCSTPSPAPHGQHDDAGDWEFESCSLQRRV